MADFVIIRPALAVEEAGAAKGGRHTFSRPANSF
jgi:hypothetical protein